MKKLAYAKLVAARKECSACAEFLENPSRVAGGALDSDRIGPYSRWQGNLDARLVVVAQDFSDVDAFVKFQGWPGPAESIPTNATLVKLLSSAGLQAGLPRRGESDDKLFFTNAVLCLKRGGMQARVRARCFRACGQRFLRPTIELVGPRAVATLGLPALNAVLAAWGQPKVPRLLPLLEAGASFELSASCSLFPFAHPGRKGQQSRSIALQHTDWSRFGRWLARAA